MLAMLFATVSAFAQVGIGTTSPNAASILDITSTTAGVLVPRMTEAQKILIALPVASLLIYQTDGASGFWYFDGSVWQPLAAALTFQTTANVTSNYFGFYGGDDFVFGSWQLADVGIQDLDARMFFDKSKGAFRAGTSTTTFWDDVNVGFYSTAMGFDTTASGTGSTAMGFFTQAGLYSTAMGGYTTASGEYSTVMGGYTTASGDQSTAMGFHTTAPSHGETSIGTYNTVYTPNNPLNFNAADRLFTIGNGTGAGSESNALTILKNGTMNINDAYNMPSADGTNGQVLITDGAGNATWSSIGAAFTIFKSIANVTSNAFESYGADDFVVGSSQLADTGNTAQDARMFFDKSKGAFRVGRADATQWDDVNVGLNSIGMGNDTRASGEGSTAMGNATTASGDFSTAMGNATTASGDFSTAMGSFTTASGSRSTAMGVETTASGFRSTAMGFFTTASGTNATASGNSSLASGTHATASGDRSLASGIASTAMGLIAYATGNASTAMGAFTEAASFASTAIGRYNVGGGNPTVTIATDPVFEVGNGTSNGNRSNALTVLKNGNTTVTGSLKALIDFRELIPLGANFSNFNNTVFLNPNFYKDNERVYLEGLVTRGSSLSTLVGILPAGHRPPGRLVFMVISNDGPIRVDVLNNGRIEVLQSGSNFIWLSLSGLSFRVNN
jgi:hypothetical protein